MWTRFGPCALSSFRTPRSKGKFYQNSMSTTPRSKDSKLQKFGRCSSFCLLHTFWIWLSDLRVITFICSKRDGRIVQSTFVTLFYWHCSVKRAVWTGLELSKSIQATPISYSFLIAVLDLCCPSLAPSWNFSSSVRLPGDLLNAFYNILIFKLLYCLETEGGGSSRLDGERKS